MTKAKKHSNKKAAIEHDEAVKRARTKLAVRPVLAAALALQAEVVEQLRVTIEELRQLDEWADGYDPGIPEIYTEIEECFSAPNRNKQGDLTAEAADRLHALEGPIQALSIAQQELAAIALRPGGVPLADALGRMERAFGQLEKTESCMFKTVMPAFDRAVIQIGVEPTESGVGVAYA